MIAMTMYYRSGEWYKKRVEVYARERKQLATSTKTKHEMQGALLLDVVIRKGATVLQLLAGEDQTLLVRRDTLLVLDLRLDVIDRVGRFDFEGDGFARESLDENLHTTTETKDEMEGALLLDVVVRKSTAILELLAGEDEALLIRWDALLVLNLGLHVVDGIRRLDFECDRLAGQGLYENLHATTQTEDKVESALLLDVVIREGAAILELLAGEDQALLVWGNSVLVLDLGLDIVDRVRRLNLESDRFTR